MHILLLTHYFPPEVNAPANRSHEHAKRWVEQGHRVTIVTAAPSHPQGIIYPGYRNRLFQREQIDGVDVIRLWTWLAPNAGSVGRILSFVSFFLSVLFQRWRLPRADAVISTSPQFFCGMAGWLLRRKGCPWVLEIRDLWPESIVAVGAMRRGRLIRSIEAVERWAYRTADLVVPVTQGFVAHIARHRGDKPIKVIRNGVVPGSFEAGTDAVEGWKSEYGLAGKFTASFVGTHGMAHGLDSLFDAAELLRSRSDIALVLVGDGAERERLLNEREARNLPNIVMIGQQPRSMVPIIWGATDAALVLLRKSDTFKTVLPTKMFEAMAAGKPVILGVEGEAQEMLLAAGAGIPVEPGNGRALADAIVALADNQQDAAMKGISGKAWFADNLDRNRLADEMLAAITALLPR
jgi:colanic acid biosynthesis glycosyl transferase WcaI